MSERHAVEQAARLSEERLAGIVALAAEAVISVDELQRITLFNRAAEQVFGYEAAEVLGRPLDLLLPEHVARSHRAHMTALPSGTPMTRHLSERRELSGRRKSGELFPAEISISSFAVGGRAVFTALLRDVSARKAAEARDRERLAREKAARAAAEEAERRAAFVADVSALLDASLDLDDTLDAIARLFVPGFAAWALVDVLEEPGVVRRVGVAYADPACAEVAALLRGYPRDQDRPFLSQRSIRGEAELVAEVTDAWLGTRSPDPAHRAAVRSLAPSSFLSVPMTARGVVLGAISLVACGGRRFGSVDLELASEVARRAGSALDRARLYAAARRASELRDRTLAVVAHDLRGPLSAVGLAARALEARSPTDAAAGEASATILDAVDLMQRLIQDLLDVASIDAGRLALEKRRLDAVVLLVRAADMFEQAAAARGVQLALDLPDELPPVEADPARVTQVVANLLDNAVKHTPAGGLVTLRARDVGAGIEVAVCDTGCGITADELPRVFDRFWRAPREGAPRGTGLGLAIAREIVEAHGGHLEVESAPERGSIFRFTLPAAPAPTPRHRAVEVTAIEEM